MIKRTLAQTAEHCQDLIGEGKFKSVAYIANNAGKRIWGKGGRIDEYLH